MNQEDKNAEICQACNLPKGSNSPGSLTQWILTCSCNRKFEDVSQEDEVNICQSCGKKVQSKKGSFTHWIFRPDLCECENPVIDPNIRIDETVDTEDDFELSASDDEIDQPELNLSGQDFPLDRFKPLSQLGQGVSSIAYLSVDRLLNKKVVIKCVLNINKDTAIRFQNEAKLITKLSHENIVSVRDIGITKSSVPYMVLDYFSGISLSDYITNTNDISDFDTLEIAKQLTRGLEYAHSKGIFHRDIKPSNILISKNSKDVPIIKIIDFGSAFLKTDNNQSDSRVIEGTPLYMPPDLPAGLEFTEQSEIYSLGCVIFELVSKHTPFTGDSAIEILRKHTEDPVPSLDEYETNSKYTKAFDKIIAKCLAKAPQDRYSSMKQLEEALNSIEYSEEENMLQAVDKEDSPETPEKKMLILKSAISIAALIFVGIWYFVNFPKTEKNIVISNKTESAPEDILLIAPGRTKLFTQVERGYTTPAGLGTFKEKHLKHLPRRTKRLELVGQITDGSGLKFLKRNGVHLTHIRLNYTYVTDKSMRYLKGMKSLKYISLSSCPISTRGIKNLGKLNLTHLYLLYCKKIDDNSLKAIAEQFPKLIKCSIGNDKITIDGIKELKKLPNLSELRLQSAAITDDTVDVLVNLNLKQLNLMNSPLSDKGLLKFKKARNLRKLTLENCNRVTAYGTKTLEKAKPGLTVKRIFLIKQEHLSIPSL